MPHSVMKLVAIAYGHFQKTGGPLLLGPKGGCHNYPGSLLNFQENSGYQKKGWKGPQEHPLHGNEKVSVFQAFEQRLLVQNLTVCCEWRQTDLLKKFPTDGSVSGKPQGLSRSYLACLLQY